MREVTGKHPAIETLAEYTEGRLPARELPGLMAHLDECEACMSEVELANDAIREEHLNPASPSARWRRDLLAVAAAAAVVFGLSFIALRQGWFRSPEGRLIAAAPHSARVVEARLSGGFAWAAYNGTMRAGETAADPERLRLAGAAADAIDRGNHDPSAPAQHVAGMALVLIDHPLEGVERLRKAASAAPKDAKSWSDLAAAEYAGALSLGRPSLYAQALGDAEHALRLDSRMPEALFNRALILGRMGLTDEERRAWADYLAVDGTSEWASEARKRLAALPVAGGATFFDRNRQRLEAAAVAGDAATVRVIVDGDRERARTFGEVEYLGRWGESFTNGDAAGASSSLAVSRAVGDALVSLSGESLLHDAVRAIDTAANPAALAEAHVIYRRGRIAYSKSNLAAAEGDLRRAAVLFAAAGDPLAFIARYYAANTRFDQHDAEGARRELDVLAEELRGRPQYIDALAQVQWELGLCRSAQGDWSGALASFTDAASQFERLGERSNMAVMNAQRAWILDLLGRPEEAWSARIAAFGAESHEHRGDRFASALGWATVAEVRAGHGEAARALLTIEERMHRSAGSDALLVHALEREAELDAALGDDAAALTAANEAGLAAGRVSDPALRLREPAVAQLAAAVAELRRDPNRAQKLLAEALPSLETARLRDRIPEAELLLARASLRLGDSEAASRAIDAGIAALDPLLVPVGSGAIATGIDDAAPGLYEEAVRLHLDRGDVAGAFAYCERARALPQGAVADAHALQQRLVGTGTAILEPFVLASEVIVFGVDEREITASRHSIARAGLESLVAHNATVELYDALIRPSDLMIARARHLIVVPSPELAAVPFAALRDGDHYLVERLPVSIAPSASAIVRGPERTRKSVIAAALPDAVGGGLAALPESGSEADDVARLYAHGEALPHPTFAALRDAAGRADVVHIAGHTARERSGDAALVLGNERVAWADIAAQPFGRADTIALAACETLRQPARADVRALSLGAAFLAAGAHHVIGTLTPISDVEARNLFREIHRQLAAGVEPSEAVRRAQLADLAAGRSGWRAVAIMTNRIPF
ncbi:MAG TPA: CHAT domain-containing protein [Thermoanaerobaculia bacterium]|nr:CHAT domain-containing protein [Thermoanaerobaculia bacterium]